MWCIAQIDAEYRERMYDVLDLYQKDFDGSEPVICVDQKSKQLLAEKQEPIRGKLTKVDYEYQRNGTQNIFVGVEPKSGKRIVKVTDHRKKADFAQYIKELVEVHYGQAQKIHIVLDHLNTHFKKSFTQTFGEHKAEQLLSLIQFHYRPKHASWLNAAEIEIGIMDTQCLNKRIPSKQQLISEIDAWQAQRNLQKAQMNWGFSKHNADEKLQKYYT